MNPNEQEPVNEWNQALPIRMIKRRGGQRAGGVLSPHSERATASAISKRRRLVSDDEAPIRHDEDGL